MVRSALHVDEVRSFIGGWSLVRSASDEVRDFKG